MMKVNIIVTGDSHYDLKTDGIDRTDDINDAKQQAIDYAVELSKKEKVIMLDLGDVFHGTHPRAEVIANVIRMYKKLDDAGIDTIVIAGNHDVIDQRGRTSALEPIAAAGFNRIYVEHDINNYEFFNINIITLPHISKAKAAEEGFKSLQDYIDTKAAEIEDELNPDDYNIVISHMNIEGALTGTETFMIKGAHEEFPKVIKNSNKINVIFNGHIHRSQIVENPNGAPIVIVGSIQVNDFSERLDRKVFVHLQIEV